MSFDVTTLALAKSYTNQHGGGGGGASTTGDFIIKMTVTSDDDGNYTVTACDTTVEQIDAAVAAERRVIVIASDDSVIFELPMFEGVKGITYYFGAFLQGQVILSLVQKVGENESEWRFGITQIQAGDVDYSNAALPNTSTVSEALDKLVPNSHTHSNKDTLDKLSDANGKLQYNGSDVGLKGDKGADGADGITPTIGENGNWYIGSTDTGKPSRGAQGDTGAAGADGYTPVRGTDYWTAADKAEIVNDVLAALPTWQGGEY